MAAQVQTSLFEVSPYITGKKRVRYKVPTYTKAYEFWHINPDTNEIEFNGDEPHIFRIQTLHKIYSDIFAHCLFSHNLLGDFEKQEYDNLIFWGEDKEGEIKGTGSLSIKKRVKIHIRLLRMLRDKDKTYSSLGSILSHRGFILKGGHK